MATEKNDKELLELLVKKISNSAIMNGGFDRLVVTVDYIKEKQEENAKKLDDVYDSLHNQENGLFSRIQNVEMVLKNHTITEDAERKQLDESLKQLKQSSENNKEALDTTKRLQRIAGQDLEEIAGVVKLKKTSTKLYIAAVMAISGAVFEVFWNLLRKS